MSSEKNNSPQRYDLNGLSNSELKEIIVELAAKNEEMSLLLNDAQKHANSCSFEIDENLELIWSDNAFEIFGLDKSNGVPKVEDFIKQIYEGDKDYVSNSFEMSFKTGKSFDITYRWKCNSGKVKFINSVAGLTIDRLTGKRRIIGTSKDITDKKNIEEEVRKGARKLEIIINTTHDGYFVLNSSGRVLENNKAFEKMTGYSSEELLHMYITDIDVYENVNESKEHFKKISIQGWDQFITKYKSKNGNIFAVEISSTYINAEEPYFICFARDITSSYLEKELLESRIRIEEFSYNHTLDELLQKCLDEAELLTGSKIGFYHFVEDDQENLHLQMWSTNTIDNMCTAEGKGSHYPISKAGVWVDCVKTKKPVVHNDYENLNHKKGLPDGHAPIIRELVVPVIRNERIKAILGVGNKLSYYNSLDIEVVEKLANLAWDIVERKRAEENLKNSEKKFKNLFQHLQQGVFYQKSDGCLYDINPAALEMFGLSKEEVLKRNSYSNEWIVVDQKGNKLEPENHPSMVALKTGKEVYNFQLGVHNPKKNSIVWLTVNAIPQFDNEGEIPSHVFVSMHDITKHKEAEQALIESEERWHFALEGSDEGVWDWNISTGEVFYSKQLQEMLGYNEGEFKKSVNEWKDRIHPEDLDEILVTLENYFSKKENIYQSEHRLKCKDGSYKWILDRGKVVSWDEFGNPTRMIGTHADIDKRKKMELALEEERVVFNEGKTVVLKWINEGNSSYIIYASRNFKTQFGYEPEEFIRNRNDFNELVHPDDIQRILSESNGFLSKKIYSYEQEYRIREYSGNYRWVYDYTTAKLDSKGNVINHIGYIYDITERKIAEEKLQLRESQLSHAMTVAKLGHWEHDFSNDILTFNDEFYTLMKTDVTRVGSYQMTSRQYADMFVHPDDLNMVPKAVQEAIESKEHNKSFHYEHRVKFGDGTVGYIAVQFSVIKNDRGETIKTIGVNQDITERVFNQHLLKNSEEKYKLLFEENKDAIGISPFDEKGILHNFTQVNKTACDLLGYTKVEFLNLSPTNIERNLTTEIISYRIMELLNTGILSFETELVCKNGNVVPAEMKTSLVIIDGEKYLMTMARDISERKVAEEKIKQANINLELAIEAGNLGTFNVDILTDKKLVNKRYLSMFGYHPGEVEVTTDFWRSLIHPEDLPKVLELTKKLEEGEILEMEVEYRAKHKSGKWIWISDRAKGFDYDEKGRPKRSAGTHKDITNLKEQEVAIRKSEAKFHALYDAITDGITIIEITENDEIGKILEVNETAATMLGYSRDEMINKSPMELEVDLSKEKLLERKKKLKENEKTHFEAYFKHKDGQIIPLEINASVVLFNDTPAIMNLARDISERKAAAKILLESEQKLRSYIDNAPDSIFVVNDAGKYLMANTAACNLFGYTEDEFKQISISQMLHPNELELGLKHFNTLKHKGKAVGDFRMPKKNGEYVYVTVDAVRLTENTFLGFTKDITKRKIAELALAESEQRYKSIVSELLVGVTIHVDGAIVFANKAIVKMMGGQNENDFLGRNVLEFVHPDEQKMVAELIINGMQLSNSGSPETLIVEERLIRLDGTIINVEASAIAINYYGKLALMVMINDVTEKKKAVKALEENQQKLQSIFDTMEEGLTLNELMYNEKGEIEDYVILEVNKAFERLTKTNKYNVVGKLGSELYKIPKDYIKHFWTENLNSDKDIKTIMFIKEANVWFHVSTSRPLNGKFVASFFDITDLKNAETLLRESEQNLITLINATPDIICFKDGQGKWLKANDGMLSLYELDGVDYVGKTEWEMAPLTHQCYKESFKISELTDQLAWKFKVQSRTEEIILRSSGEKRIYDVIKVPIFNDDGSRKALVVFGRDITERKRAEEKLSKQLLTQELITRIATNFINIEPDQFDFEINNALEQIGIISSVDRAYLFQFSIDMQFFSNTHEWCAEGISHEKDNLQNIEAAKLEWWTSKLINKEVIYLKNLSEIPQQAKLERNVLEAQGIKSLLVIPIGVSTTITGFIGFDSVRSEKSWDDEDILLLQILGVTINNALMRIQFLQSLKESEDKFRKSFMTSPDAVNINRMNDGLYIDINEGFTKMTGFTLEDVKGKTSSEISIWVNLDDRKKLVDELLENGSCTNLEAQFKIKDGTVKTGLMSAAPLMIKGEKCILSITRDITDRKNAEIALRESEEKFKALFEMSPDAIFVHSGGKMLFANHNTLKLLKYPSINEFRKITIYDIVHPEYHEIVRERIRLVREEGKEIPPLYEKYVCYDGSIIDVEVVAAELLIDGVKAFQVLARDISERIKSDRRTKLQRDLNVALIKSKSLEEAAKTIFTFAKLMLEVDSGGLYLTTKEGGLKILDSFGLSPRFCKLIKFHASNTRNAQIAQSGNSVFVGYESIKKLNDPLMLKEGLKSVAVIPLIFEDRIGAVLNLASRSIYEFNERQRSNIEAFSLMCGAFVGRLLAEKELKASEDKFRKFFEADLAGDYKSLIDGTLIECNNAFVKMLEFSSKEEALSTNMKEIYPQKENRSTFLNRLKKSKSLELIETRLVTKNGREVIVLENVLADYDEKGKFIGATGYMIDVTKLKLSEMALIESERNYRELFRRMQSGFALHEIITNKKGKPINYRFISVNPKFEKLTGLKSKDIVGKTVLEILPQTENYWIETYGKVALTGKPITYENYSKEIGKYYKVVAYSPEKNKFATIIEDITDAKIAEGKIRQLSTAVEQSSVAVVITDMNGLIEYINPMFTKITGYSKTDLIGKVILIESDNEDNEKLNKQIWKKIKEGKDWSGTYRNKRKNGEFYWESSIISPVRDSNGIITHYISIKDDISEKKAKDQELEAYKNHLEDEVNIRTKDLQHANIKLNEEIVKQKNTEELLKVALSKEKELSDLKTRFISTTSHEFRTPLTSILSSTDLLQKYGKKWSDTKFAEHADRTRRAVEYLVKLLDDILTISRTESGKINFAPTLIDLKTFCKDIIVEAKPSALNNHKLVFKYNPKQHEFMIDPKLLKFILLNLLVNAIKYSPGGGEIRLSVSSDKMNLILRVSDQGIGIPNEEKSYIFDNFYRSKNSIDIPGTGLGLAIVKKSVELHKGTVTFVSKLNVGTTFVVTLPKSYSEAEEKTNS